MSCLIARVDETLRNCCSDLPFAASRIRDPLSWRRICLIFPSNRSRLENSTRAIAAKRTRNDGMDYRDSCIALLSRYFDFSTGLRKICHIRDV